LNESKQPAALPVKGGALELRPFTGKVGKKSQVEDLHSEQKKRL